MRVVASPLEASFDREIQFSRLETRFVVITLLRNGKRVSNEGYSREYDKVHLIDSNSVSKIRAMCTSSETFLNGTLFRFLGLIRFARLILNSGQRGLRCILAEP